MEALGRLCDIVAGVAPLDLQTARTGVRVHMKNASSAMVVVFKGAGTAGDDPTITLKQHTASTSGTSANLSIIDHYYLKKATSLAGSETWTRYTQSAAATIVDPGGATTSAEEQQILVIHVDGAELSDGYEWISLDTTDTGSNAQLGAVLYLLCDLTVQRAPANLANPQA
jgi:hypothetical protein